MPRLLFAFKEDTMTPINPTIRSMTFDEQFEYGLCNRGLMMEQDERTYRLTAGTTDSLYVFKAGAVVYVLTLNLSLEYVVLDYYVGSEGEPVDSVFLQGDYVISECVGKDWRSVSMSEVVRRLLQLFA
jgi:hypothetical protein